MAGRPTSDYISAELAATCAELGYYDGTKYHLDHHCIYAMKDLIRYLRNDDDNHTVRRYLGQSNLLQTDLIKIFVEHSDQTELCNILLRLLINLTSPAFIIYNEELPTDKVPRGLYQQVVSHLQGYKVAFVNDCIWTVVNNCLSKILNIESSDRSEENKFVIERILLLIRNVLQIPPDDNEKRTNNDATVHDELLFALHTSGTVDLLLFIASNNSEQFYHIQVLEIIFLMLREQSASKLASVGLQRSIAEKEQDEAKLLATRQKEIKQKMEKVKKYAGSRHSRFGGVYVVQNMKAIGDNQLICHKPYQKIEVLEFNQQKRRIKKPKNKMPMAETSGERISVLSVRLFLKEFCIEFLNGVYNPVMKNVKFFIDHENDKSAIDVESCYFWALRFFMEFNRHYKFQVKYVSETISTGIFHLVQKQMECYYEIITGKIDKKDVPFYSRRLHVVIKAYKELLYTLIAMDSSTDKGVRESSKVIKNNLFYVPEYRDLILRQLLNYNELRMPRSYLTDLIETVHIFLKMLEQFCNNGRKVVVQKTKVQRRKKRQKSTKEEQPPPPSLEDRWDNVGSDLSAVLQNDAIPEIIPFDDTLDVPDDEQKANAMKRIQKLLRGKLFEEAVGLLRSAREAWPEDDCFGRSDIPVEEEFLALREIFFADLGVVEEETRIVEMERNVGNSSYNENDHDDDDDEEEEVEKRMSAYEEIDFNFKDFVQRFVNAKAVKACAIILQQFESNTVEINHYVIKLLHRIAWDIKMPAMLFQASIFRIFQRILDSKEPEHAELQKFATFIIRSFVKVAQKNQKSFMELLFWKTTHEATEMVEGYEAESNCKKVSRTVWTEAEEDELRTLFMEHQTNKYPQDLIDWILENIINENRTRRAVMKKLKEMYLIVNSRAVKNEIQKRLPKEWSEDEIAQLVDIWDRVKEDEDPVDLIYAEIRIKRPKPKIKEKLLELRLAEDQKQLRKKRSRKSNPGKSYDSEADDDHSNTFEKRARAIHSRKRHTSVPSDAKICKLLKDAIEKNMSEALEWIVESLEDALEDRDEECSEGIPLIPLTDYSSAAMDSPSFQRFLRSIGIEPPVDEQETYWRLSSSTLNSTIRKRCDLITAALSGKFVTSEDTVREEESDVNNESSEDDGNDIFENVKKFIKPRTFDLEASSYHNDGSESRSPKKQSNSESGEQNEKEVVDDVRIVDLTDDIKTKINEQTEALLKMSDLNEVNSDINESERENIADDFKRHRLESPDIETPLTKKRRILDSDEEDNTEYLENFKTKCNRKIDSDDED